MRTLILLAGDLWLAAWDNIDELSGDWDLIICADGGGRHALMLRIRPHILLGDFDSLSDNEREAIMAPNVMTFPTDKDKTDAHLAVEEALRRGASHITLAGALGGRLDHTLANIALLRLIHRQGATSLATDGHQTVYYVTRQLSLSGFPGQQLSVLPLTPQVGGLTLGGLRWPLRSALVKRGDTRTMSNEFVGGPATVQLTHGEVLVIVSHQQMR